MPVNFDYLMKRRTFWKILLNLWTLIAVLTMVIDFFNKNLYNEANGIVSAIYIVILGIYTADKEFDRWTAKNHFISISR